MDNIVEQELQRTYTMALKVQRACTMALKKFGVPAQTIKAVEELAELQQALCKKILGEKSNITEELADVFIMCEQIKCAYVDPDELDIMIDAKLNRLNKMF